MFDLCLQKTKLHEVLFSIYDFVDMLIDFVLRIAVICTLHRFPAVINKIEACVTSFS